MVVGRKITATPSKQAFGLWLGLFNTSEEKRNQNCCARKGKGLKNWSREKTTAGEKDSVSAAVQYQKRCGPPKKREGGHDGARE